jgi:hypothetical protein
MKRFSLSMAFGLAVLAFGATAKSANAADERPFSAEALVEVVDTYKNGFLTAGVGEATHLGDITVMGAVRVNGNRSSSRIVLTGAAGDSIVMQSDTVFDPELGHFVGVYTVDGGTGRFAGATGYGVINPIPLGGGQFEVHYDGVISY